MAKRYDICTPRPGKDKTGVQFERGLSVELVRACFNYNAKTGRLSWKIEAGGKLGQGIGDEAGSVSKNKRYRRVGIFNQVLFAHRIAWAVHYGEWPLGMIDHINGDGCDNRINNLRLATNSENQANRAADKTAKHSRFKGVDRTSTSGLWRARCGPKHLGVFQSEEDAARAYDLAAVARWGNFAKLNFKEISNG